MAGSSVRTVIESGNTVFPSRLSRPGEGSAASAIARRFGAPLMRIMTRILMMFTLPMLIGCGSSNTIWVTGKLLKGGSPFTPPEGRSNQVVLIAMDVKDDAGKTVGNNEPYAAVVNPADATFEVPGPEGRGIPPGKYRISVTQVQRTKRSPPPKKRGEKVV